MTGDFCKSDDKLEQMGVHQLFNSRVPILFKKFIRLKQPLCTIWR